MSEKYCDLAIPPRGVPTRAEYEEIKARIDNVGARIDNVGAKADAAATKTELNAVSASVEKIRFETYVTTFTGNSFTITLKHQVKDSIVAQNGDSAASSHQILGTHLANDGVTLTVKIDDTVTNHAYRVNVAYNSTD